MIFETSAVGWKVISLISSSSSGSYVVNSQVITTPFSSALPISLCVQPSKALRKEVDEYITRNGSPSPS